MARILLLDDSDALRTTLAAILARDGHEVTEAPDGRRGAQKLREATFDLLITDLIMPDGEGLETIMAARRNYPAMPVIAMSGGSAGSHSYLAAAAQLGARLTLAKPFGADDLRNAVNLVLNG